MLLKSIKTKEKTKFPKEESKEKSRISYRNEPCIMINSMCFKRGNNPINQPNQIKQNLKKITKQQIKYENKHLIKHPK